MLYIVHVFAFTVSHADVMPYEHPQLQGTYAPTAKGREIITYKLSH